MEESGPPAKRARLDDAATPKTSQGDEQLQRELASGIAAFVNPQTATFSGVLKQRYTDFLVNEILPGGEVLHLHSLKAPKKSDVAEGVSTKSGQSAEQEPAPPKPTQEAFVPDGMDADFQPADADRQALVTIFGEECVDKVVALAQAVTRDPKRKPRDFEAVISPPIESRPTRTEAHQAVRKVFMSKLETVTQDDNTIKFVPAPKKQSHGGGDRANNQAGKLGWDELGGEYVHFSLYKENKDTMECISFFSSQSKINNKRFSFAGTKDRRAVTVQRACAFRVHAHQLEYLGKRLRSGCIGDFAYRPKALDLGELAGNEFVIALRDCHFPGEEGLDTGARLGLATKALAEIVPAFERDGFLNYYGLQRFGSFRSTTDVVGKKMLQGDLKGAVDILLHFEADALAAAQSEDPEIMISSDDKNRAMGLDTWNKTQDSHKALKHMPKKFSAECSIIRTLGSRNKSRINDYQGALQTVPRSLRLMYVHAYQSLVWNTVAGERWRLFGSRVVQGDLVIDESAKGRKQDEPEVDESGEPIVRPAEDDAADTVEDQYTRARPLSQEEANSGKFGIFDVVLPLPGFDVVYPPNEIGKVYETFMASEQGGGLDPHDMRRAWKDVSLSGGYRLLLARPLAPMSYEVKTYGRDDEQLTETDRERMQKQERAARGEEVIIPKDDEEDSAMAIDEAPVQAAREQKIAVILKLQLGPSQYATMALRELLGGSGVKTYQSTYSGSRQ